MSAPKFTPGPWLLKIEPYTDTLTPSEPFCTVTGGNGGYMGEGGFEFHGIAREIDARLIAAAPDLYNGCNALLGLIQLVLNRDDLTPDLRVALGNSHRLIEAKAAIAKVRGEQVPA